MPPPGHRNGSPMPPPGGCGCHCSCSSASGGAAPSREVPLGALADLENGRPADPLQRIEENTVNRMFKLFFRGLLILLWVHVYDSMRRYAINHVGQDTWFSTFAVIVVAVPITEFFCIVGKIVIPPRSFALWQYPFLE